MSDELLSRITRQNGTAGGQPTIRGMRIRVQDVLDMLVDGGDWDEILADYPYLEADDIRASLLYAALAVANQPEDVPHAA